MRVLIDGKEANPDDAGVSVFDWAVMRGFGCFEVIRSYEGVPFRAGEHVDRMEASADALGLRLPDRADIESWIGRIAEAGGDCFVRCYLTGGSRDSLVASPPRFVVFWEELVELPDVWRLLPVKAPWHAEGEFSELTRAKTLSYAQNMAASAVAHAAGFDDALLIGRNGTILEGPTFSICWIREGGLYTPSLEVGILESITRRLVLQVAETLGIEVHEGFYTLDELGGDAEVLAMSTIKEAAVVGVVGAMTFRQGPLGEKLTAEVERVVADEVAA